ncbi:glycoside hydrolase family 2 TIM barrel-domain containing protein [Marinilabilia sp.]|uniref:glycoside hydrolase family 2 protein n=1 Tax=Marinilabilia sp. TaxID=2021252 RepID=UPI0025BBEBF9|nr:glycoside hydrolase family 2 TIM barrel-domain containing protein [Marinilabilia sp.]
MKRALLILISTLAFFSCQNKAGVPGFHKRANLFNNDWEFVKGAQVGDVGLLFSSDDSTKWEKVTIPHTAHIEPLVLKERQWQGTSFYKKSFTVPASLNGKHVAVKFEGAMQVADVYLNGKHLMTHEGGYLPFYYDLSNELKYGDENILLVKLNNEDNPLVPPGKPIDDLDFNWFSGIYRNVWLFVKDQVHISDPIEAGKVAGGGLFVTYSEVSGEKATVNLKVDVVNDGQKAVEVSLNTNLVDADGNNVASGSARLQMLNAGTHLEMKTSFDVEDPQLWSPDNPNLYQLNVEVLNNGKVVDKVTETIGIRTFKWTAGEFILNGEPLFLRGTNRHQEYPYIGYALSDNAHYRDAYKIKQAGFNFVRLSHYPHSKSFMQACDELGLLTMDAIPGWQFFGNEEFQERAILDVRNMVRRDRNHPSVVVWEASLNESGMSLEFMQRAHNAVHEEYPHQDVYTCGWVDEVYDIYIPARQHGKPPHYWNQYDNEKPIFIAEYGDWEYYAQNAGFNQTAFEDLTAEERNSRQLRGFGQKRLAQQAINYQEAHNSNLQGPACGDANWLMYDYNRGYAPDIEASGIMDIFRLPKFAYYFYKSQADIKPEISEEFYSPFIEIANFYNDPSFTDVKVYSNCDEVELLVNSRSLGRQKPDQDRISSHLDHPPFTFHLDNFEPGELVAKGFVDGKEVTKAMRRTPGEAAGLTLWFDESGRPLENGRNDVVFLYASVTDAHGTVVPEASQSVTFEVEGDATLIGANPINAEAGIATVLLKAGNRVGAITVTASSNGLKSNSLVIEVK